VPSKTQFFMQEYHAVHQLKDAYTALQNPRPLPSQVTRQANRLVSLCPDDVMAAPIAPNLLESPALP
jgi:hypothetical protein